MAAPARPVARLTPDQQRVAKLGAVMAAVVFVAAWVPLWADEGLAIVASAVGVAMAALLYWAARRGTLVLTALAALAVSFSPAWDGLWILGAPYIAWPGLLLYRASKEASAAAGPREPRRKKKTMPEPGDEPAERRPPDRSKRYTPPVSKKRR